MPRIGMYGGAFDPPHAAHLAVARAAIAQAKLDVLHLIPTGLPLHRAAAQIQAHHRLAMLRLAFEGVRGVEIDDREIKRDGASFSIDSVLELKAQYAATRVCVVIGQDQFERLDAWHRWSELRANAIFLIAARPMNTVTTDQKEAKIRKIEPPDKLLDLPELDVSATQLRKHLAEQVNLAHADAAAAPHGFLSNLHPNVLRYIAQHRLYT